MSKQFALAVAIAAIAMALAATGWANPTAPRKTLTAFASEDELAAVLKRWSDEAKRRRDEPGARRSAQSPAAVPAPQAMVAPKEAAAGMADSVTNVQHAGVDEGGIVKVHGDHLVILRRGRLFTIAIGDKQLKPVSSIEAFGPDVDPGGAWYDEMLISGDTIAIIGYSYARG
ncbi:MAG: beta-propeller domain-containing protein, partial [Burkholderiales bacterium]